MFITAEEIVIHVEGPSNCKQSLRQLFASTIKKTKTQQKRNSHPAIRYQAFDVEAAQAKEAEGSLKGEAVFFESSCWFLGVWGLDS